jgi:hypothetical protein
MCMLPFVTTTVKALCLCREKLAMAMTPTTICIGVADMGCVPFSTTQPILLSKRKSPTSLILERCIYHLRRSDVYLVADGYRGAKIKQCTVDFLNAAAGNNTDTLNVSFQGKSVTLQLAEAPLLCYVGHSALMDFKLDSYPQRKGSSAKAVIILACASRVMYHEAIKSAGAQPLLWTTNLMCPEAYTLKAAIDGWILNESGQQIRQRAAETYNQYQKCGMKGALGLFYTGF